MEIGGTVKMHYDMPVMAGDFLSQLLGSASRARVLRVFAFSPHEPFTASFVAKRAGVPVGVATKEITDLEKIGVLKKKKVSITFADSKKQTGKQKELTWSFDEEFKYARALSLFIHEIAPIQHSSIVDSLKGSGRLAIVILSGTFIGDASRPADLIVVADPLYEKRLEQAIRAMEPQLGREIRYAAFSTPEFRYRLTIQDRLIRDIIDFPHLVLLDRDRLL
ncbi:hypothetical protein C4585_01865 [Candidatus Parcubacteria bacterium]|nr:MAG: hypothetical protein C4585_01865 [Candidatus Parcubacteria bacterium]